MKVEFEKWTSMKDGKEYEMPSRALIGFQC